MCKPFIQANPLIRVIVHVSRLCPPPHARQRLYPQLEALRAVGCAVICKEGAGKELARALARCGGGDVLVVWKLSRLGGSRDDLTLLAEDLRKCGAGLKVLTGAGAAAIDRVGSDFPDILAAVAEFERELIGERTTAGLKAAKRRGGRVGRKLKLTPQDIARARQWIEDGRARTDVADLLGVSAITLRRALRA
jgi:DNA invertase Pin-like site-specific DNA recombinase